MVPSRSATNPSDVNWRHVGWFIGVTFGLTWLLDLYIYLSGGMTAAYLTYFLELQMLIPAFSAISIQTLFIQASPLHYRVQRSASRWFTYFFMLTTLVFVFAIPIAAFFPGTTGTLAKILSWLPIIGLVLALVVRRVGGKDVFNSIGMGGGQFRWWLVAWVSWVAFFVLLTALNRLFNLGTWSKPAAVFPDLANIGWSDPAIWLYAGILFLLIAPFGALFTTFGEEYGWRGYLQNELTRLGRVQGVFLVGVVWGLWHAPLILMGYNYPDQPVLGVVAMVIFCILMSYILAYAVFKSKGLWTAVFWHALHNSLAPFFLGTVYVTTSTMFSFSLGLYAFIPMGLIVLLVLRDPLWRADRMGTPISVQ
jgi:membrane protease YdiL (CAAX protease family)